MALQNIDVAKEATSQEILSKLASSGGGTKFVTSSNNVLVTVLSNEISSSGSSYIDASSRMFVSGDLVGTFKIRASIKGSSISPSTAATLYIEKNSVETALVTQAGASYATKEALVRLELGDVFKFRLKFGSGSGGASCNLITICGDVGQPTENVFTTL